MRLNIPLDSIEEFQVQSQNFGADAQSGTSGGQVSVVSPSGTNRFHGQAFNYFSLAFGILNCPLGSSRRGL
jgi:hypothetical protein